MLDTKFWKKYFKEYDILNKLIPYDELLNRIIELADIRKGYYVLDAGSGTGNLSIRATQYGAQVTSLDFSPEGIMLHVQKEPNAKVIQHDLTKPLPFVDSTFDVVMSNNVLYTIPRAMRSPIYKELYRVLRPGGICVIANLSDRFSPIGIYTTHLKEYKNRYGLSGTILHMLSLIVPTIRIFYYNYLINNENKSGQYDFFHTDEQLQACLDAGFSTVYPTEYVYAKQSVLNKAIK